MLLVIISPVDIYHIELNKQHSKNFYISCFTSLMNHNQKTLTVVYLVLFFSTILFTPFYPEKGGDLAFRPIYWNKPLAGKSIFSSDYRKVKKEYKVFLDRGGKEPSLSRFAARRKWVRQQDGIAGMEYYNSAIASDPVLHWRTLIAVWSFLALSYIAIFFMLKNGKKSDAKET